VHVAGRAGCTCTQLYRSVRAPAGTNLALVLTDEMRRAQARCISYSASVVASLPVQRSSVELHVAASRGPACRPHARAHSQLKPAPPSQTAHGQAPGGTQSVAEWRAIASALHARTHPSKLCGAMRTLASVAMPADGAQQLDVIEAMLQLMTLHSNGGYRHATFLDAVGTGLARQPQLRVACLAHADFTARISGLLHAATHAPDTYTDERHIAQVATAQAKLGLYCAAFWRRLEERGVGDIEARQLATLAFCAGKLVKAGVGAAPSPALWSDMQRAVEVKAELMDTQQLANVFIALRWQV